MSIADATAAAAIEQLMAQAIYTPLPTVPGTRPRTLPADLAAFHARFGAVTLYPDAEYGFTLAAADNLQRADEHVVGEDIDEPLSAHWYVIATCGDQTIAICLAEGPTFGTCYDAYWDCYPTADASTRIAGSFTELLARLVADEGRSLFWIAGHR
ncbi:hypothetical protein [Stenotrophomonas sp.]|uniref:hypothetical protein n=1 Tax=Stenotrophomonas sp. TaxID=69392 RepID=UPI002FCAB553